MHACMSVIIIFISIAPQKLIPLKMSALLSPKHKVALYKYTNAVVEWNNTFDKCVL